MGRKILAYWQLARLNKPWGIVLLAWPTVSALLLTNTVDKVTWCVFILGIVLTRSAGCVINDYADQWLDGSVERTKSRPLPSGEVQSNEALVFFIVLMGFSALLLFFLNNAARIAAVVSGALLCIYPYTKRYIAMPQLFLGIVFSMGIPVVCLNQGYDMDIQIWVLLALNAYWVVVYDTIYAMTDQKDDQEMGACSMALYLGDNAIGFVQYSYIMIWVLWGIWGILLQWPFYLCWLGVGINYYQQVALMHNKAYFKAFLLNQFSGSLIVLGILLSKIYIMII